MPHLGAITLAVGTGALAPGQEKYVLIGLGVAFAVLLVAGLVYARITRRKGGRRHR